MYVTKRVDRPGADSTSPAGYSEAVKRVKLRCLQMLLLQAPACRAMVFCRTQLDCALVHRFLQSLDGQEDAAACGSVVLSAQGHRQDRTAALEVCVWIGHWWLCFFKVSFWGF